MSFCYIWLCFFLSICCSQVLLDLSTTTCLNKGCVYTNEGISCGGMVFIPPIEFHRLGQEHRSCSGGSWGPVSILRNFMLGILFICPTSVDMLYINFSSNKINSQQSRNKHLISVTFYIFVYTLNSLSLFFIYI